MDEATAMQEGQGTPAAEWGTHQATWSKSREKGRAVDFDNTPGAYAWLDKNASRFGLQTNANSGGWEKWHVSPTGR